MLKLDDIVALAKQGYKPNDIKELIELSKTSETSDQKEDLPAPEENKPTKDIQTEELPAPEETKTPSQGTTANEASDTKVVDYKAKVEELEAKLAELQKANTRRNIADTDIKSDSDVFADAMKSFM